MKKLIGPECAGSQLPNEPEQGHKDKRIKIAECNDNEQQETVSSPKNSDVSEVEGLTESELSIVLDCESVCGDESFMWEMIEATQGSITEKLGLIESANEQTNFKSISRFCHTIKGSAKMVSLEELAVAAEDCEKLFSEEQPDKKQREILLGALRKAVARINKTKRKSPNA